MACTAIHARPCVTPVGPTGIAQRSGTTGLGTPKQGFDEARGETRLLQLPPLGPTWVAQRSGTTGLGTPKQGFDEARGETRTTPARADVGRW